MRRRKRTAKASQPHIEQLENRMMLAADLAVTRLKGPSTMVYGSTYTIYTEWANLGDSGSGRDISYDLYVADENGQKVGELNNYGEMRGSSWTGVIPSIPAGKHFPGKRGYKLVTDLPSGSYQIVATIGTTSGETKTWNNQLSIPVRIRGSDSMPIIWGTPDVTVSELSPREDRVEPGESVTVDFSFGNIGTDETGDVDYQIYLSNDRSLNTTYDTLLKSSSLWNVKPGDQHRWNSTFTIPQTQAGGEWFVFIKLTPEYEGSGRRANNLAWCPIYVAPKTIVVDTASDTIDANDGKTSLREAILQANNGVPPGSGEAVVTPLGVQDITFADSLRGSTIALASSLPRINRSMKFVGLGKTDLTISGGKTSSSAPDIMLFDVTSRAASLFLENITIADATYGIHSPGDVALTSAVVRNMRYDALSFRMNSEQGTLSLNDVLFDRVLAVLVSGDMEAENVTFREVMLTTQGDVTATGLTIQDRYEWTNYGTAHVDGLTLQTGSHFVNKGVSVVNGLIIADSAAYGGEHILNSGDISISNATVRNNVSVDGSGAGLWVPRHARGGVLKNLGTMRISDSLFEGNSVRDGDEYAGGAIFNQGVLYVDKSQFIDNSSNEGGAIFNTGSAYIEECLFEGNTADIGGAIHNSIQYTTDLPMISVVKSQLVNNVATTLLDGNGGGAIKNEGVAKILDSTFDGNRSAQAYGAIGSVAYGTFEPQTTISKSTFVGNVSGSWGGAVGALSADNSTAPYTFSIENSTFSGNIAAEFGGAADFAGTGDVDLVSTTLFGNQVESSATEHGGGGVSWLSNVDLTLSHSIITGNLQATRASDAWGVPNAASGYNILTSFDRSGMSAGSNGNLQRSAASVLDTVLRDNGGPTPTHSLVSNSPAINRGDAAYAGDTGLVLDQRGGPRVAGGRVDIGAVESGSTVVAGSASTYHATLASGLSNPSLEPAVATEKFASRLLTNGESFDLSLGDNANGDETTLSFFWIGPGSVTLNYIPATGSQPAKVLKILIRDATATSRLDLTASSDAAPGNLMSVDIDHIDIIDSAGFSLGLAVFNTSVSVGNVIANSSLTNVSIPQLNGLMSVTGNVTYMTIGGFSADAKVLVSGNLDYLSIGKSLEGLVHAGSIGELETWQDLTGSVISDTTIDEVIVNGVLGGTRREASLLAPGGLGRLKIGMGVVGSPRIELNGNTQVEVRAFGRGDATSGVQVLDSTFANPVIQLSLNGEAVARNLPGRPVLSLAGFPDASYVFDIAVTGPWRLGLGVRSEFGDTPLSAVDVDGDGEFSLLHDGHLIDLALNQDAASTQLTAYKGQGSTRSGSEIKSYVEKVSSIFDVDRNGQYEVVTDRLLLQVGRSNSLSDSQVQRFMAPDATATVAEVREYASWMRAAVGEDLGALNVANSTGTQNYAMRTEVGSDGKQYLVVDYHAVDSNALPAAAATIQFNIAFDDQAIRFDRSAAAVYGYADGAAAPNTIRDAVFADVYNFDENPQTNTYFPTFYYDPSYTAAPSLPVQPHSENAPLELLRVPFELIGTGSTTISLTFDEELVDTAFNQIAQTASLDVRPSTGIESLLSFTSAGYWLLNTSDGAAFTQSTFAYWSTAVEWDAVLQGDFNGDGLQDVAGRTHIGQWWSSINQGDGTAAAPDFMIYWKPSLNITHYVSGDFNGDGRTDVAGISSNGVWWGGLARSDTVGFSNTRMGAWSTALTFTSIETGDFNGDGRTDIAGLSSTGQWIGLVGKASGGWETVSLGFWSPALKFTNDIVTGDFNGDGKTDIAGRTEAGQWWAAIANTDTVGFTNALIGGWSTSVSWKNVNVGDFNGDGQADIIARASNGQWWGLVSDGTAGLRTNTHIGYWNPNVVWTGIITGDADGDGRDDLIGRVAGASDSARGRLWVAKIIDGSLMQTSKWGFQSIADNVASRDLFFAGF